jgi:hypothetical protein
MSRIYLHAVLISVLGLASDSPAESAVLSSIADTTLIELMPDNNMGGHVFFNAGTTLNGYRNRGLLRFNPLGGIPAGSKIKSVQLILEVVEIPADEPAGGNFQLHRVLRAWGEGNKTSFGGPGRGDVATEDETTWNHRYALTTNTWAAPGGLAGTDFSSAASGEQFIEPAKNQYVFGSFAQMVADVQLWLDQPGTNHGWLLKVEDEETRTTARRFASREDTEYGPLLVVEFDPPPKLQVILLNSELHLSFVAAANVSYTLETKTSLAEIAWSSLTNIAALPQDHAVQVTNSANDASGFFRLLVTE